MQPKRKIHPAVAALIVIVLVGIVTSVAFAINSSDTAKEETSTTPTNQTSATTPEASSPPATTETSSSNTSAYADGTYNATASYVTPGGIESIDVTVTISGGVITDSLLAGSGKTDHAERHQADFAAGYKSMVVGKNVDDVQLSRVSGASLTSNAFNNALDEIKIDAEA